MHLSFAGPFGGLGLLLWVVGLPVATLLLLREVKSSLRTADTRAQFGFLYKGYKPQAYFWESVVMFRKVLVALISVFLKSYGVVVQALLS